MSGDDGVCVLFVCVSCVCVCVLLHGGRNWDVRQRLLRHLSETRGIRALEAAHLLHPAAVRRRHAVGPACALQGRVGAHASDTLLMYIVHLHTFEVLKCII